MRVFHKLLLFAAFTMVAIVAAAPAASADHTNSTATLSSTQNGDPDGTGTVDLTFNSSAGEVCYTLTTNNIGAATASHIHLGAAGSAGPVVVNFDIANNGLSGCVPVPASVIADIEAAPADHYINVHTAEFPGGAIRSQLAMTTPSVNQTSTFDLMPTGDPAATGSVVMDFNPTTGEICFEITTDTMETVNAAHIHIGEAGDTGAILVGLDFATNGLMGCVDAAPADVETILADPAGHYVNVHTDESMSGAVRGQIAATSSTTNDLSLNLDGLGFGDLDGSGTATFTFYPGGDICFAITAENIAEVTVAHIHIGGENDQGGVLVDLEIPANGLNGCVSSTDAAIEAITADPTGHYVNLHNAEFRAGAIRGQLQATTPAPATTAISVPLLPSRDADGSGNAEIDIDPATGRVCFTMTFENIDTVTAAHIHVGDLGMDGAPVINLGVPISGEKACVFSTPEIAMMVTEDLAGHYVNIHTDVEPEGAIRAQLDGSTLAVTPTAVPATAVPATAVPATAVPATAVPATAVPATAVPATAVPATAVPATAVPATAVPATATPDFGFTANTTLTSPALAATDSNSTSVFFGAALVSLGAGILVLAGRRLRLTHAGSNQ